MPRDSFQRAMADFLHSPNLCRKAKYGELDNYDLTPSEAEQLRSIASHPGMIVNCMIYRAGRLVGISRNLPMTLHLLGSAVRQLFDSYITAYPSAEIEFEAEALNFSTYINSLDTGCLERFGIKTNELLAVLAKETQHMVPLD